MPPGVFAEHGAWMLEMRMLRAETPTAEISAAGKYWTSAAPGACTSGYILPRVPAMDQMSLLGTSRTWCDVCCTAALGVKADMARTARIRKILEIRSARSIVVASADSALGCLCRLAKSWPAGISSNDDWACVPGNRM